MELVYLNSDGPPDNPDYIWIKFDEYCGEEFFPDDPTRKHWVPIVPMTAT